MEKVSVIVPLYNAEKYLKRCLDSIICQTYSNLEIIVIDDFSSDDSYKTALDYSKLDSRIKVYKNKVNRQIINLELRYIYFRMMICQNNYFYKN